MERDDLQGKRVGRLKEVVTEKPNLSDIILKAFLARRSPRIVYRQTGRCSRLMCEGTTGQGGEVCLRGDGRKKRGPGLLRPDPPWLWCALPPLDYLRA